MARIRTIPKNPPFSRRNYFLVDACFLVEPFLPVESAQDSEKDRIRECRRWWKEINRQVDSKRARVYVPDVCIAEAFKALAKKYYQEEVFNNSAHYKNAREGTQMFGVLSCQNGSAPSDHGLAIGLRNSYDRSLSVGLVAGTRVFCCDNLAFSGEVGMRRKHTANVFRDLPDLIYRMLSQVKAMGERQETEIRRMKATELSVPETHHLMVKAVRERIIPASKLPKVIEAWDKPKYPEFEPRTAWSLTNAFTEVMKSRSARAQMDGSLRLAGVFRQFLSS